MTPEYRTRRLAPAAQPWSTRAMAPDDLLNLFRASVSEVVERDVPELSADSNIASMGIDSLQMLEIVGNLERELQISVPDDELVGIETVGQLLSLVQKKLPSGEAAPS